MYHRAGKVVKNIYYELKRFTKTGRFDRLALKVCGRTHAPGRMASGD